MTDRESGENMWGKLGECFLNRTRKRFPLSSEAWLLLMSRRISYLEPQNQVIFPDICLKCILFLAASPKANSSPMVFALT